MAVMRFVRSRKKKMKKLQNHELEFSAPTVEKQFSKRRGPL